MHSYVTPAEGALRGLQKRGLSKGTAPWVRGRVKRGREVGVELWVRRGAKSWRRMGYGMGYGGVVHFCARPRVGEVRGQRGVCLGRSEREFEFGVFGFSSLVFL